MNDKTAPVQMPHYGHVPHGIRMRVPWRIHQKAWEVYGKNYSQSAERMAERGGFGLMEMIYLLAGENPYEVTDEGPMFTDFFNRWPEDKQEGRADGK